MLKRLLLISLLTIVVSGCDSNQPWVGEEEIEITIEQDLQADIHLQAATLGVPDNSNALEVTARITNRGNSDRKLLLKGSWHDAGNGFFGGQDRVLTLSPDQSEVYRDATRSKHATRYRLHISATGQTQDQLLTEKIASGNLPLAPGHGMTFSETPVKENIPPWTPRGAANGMPFQAGTIMFRQGLESKWSLEISDAEFDPLKGAGIARYDNKGLQTIYINLPDTPSAGKRYVREMAYGGGYFQIQRSPPGDDTTSWNTSLAYVIEISKWEAGGYGSASCSQREQGSASGKLYISFKGSETSIKNSWVSGTFKDVPVIYCGKA